MTEVTMVRVYCTEHEPGLDAIMRCLHDECSVMGATAYRGIAGFGASRRMHEARWTDLSLDLPVVVEFFDTSTRARDARRRLSARFPGIRIVHWAARLDEARAADSDPDNHEPTQGD